MKIICMLAISLLIGSSFAFAEEALNPNPVQYPSLYDAKGDKAEVFWYSNDNIVARVDWTNGDVVEYRINNSKQEIRWGQSKSSGYLQFISKYEISINVGGNTTIFYTGTPVNCVQNLSETFCKNDSVAYMTNLSLLKEVWSTHRVDKILVSDKFSILIDEYSRRVLIMTNLETLTKATLSGCIRSVCLDAERSYYAFLRNWMTKKMQMEKVYLHAFIKNKFLVSRSTGPAYLVDTLYGAEVSSYVAEINTGKKCNETSLAQEGRFKEKLLNDAIKLCSPNSDTCIPNKYRKMETPGGKCIFSVEVSGFAKSSKLIQ